MGRGERRVFRGRLNGEEDGPLLPGHVFHGITNTFSGARICGVIDLVSDLLSGAFFTAAGDGG